MIITRALRVVILSLTFAGVGSAQLSTSLRLSKKQYVAGEPVMAVVTVTNHAGRPLTFASDGRTQWLNFIVKDSQGETVTSRESLFGKMTIKAGESLAREVDLAQHFQLSEPGNYSATAVVRMPGDVGEGSSTNRVVFSQMPGTPYWTQKVGIPGKPGHTREYRLLSFNGENRSQLYTQVMDGATGQNVRTFLLGDILTLRKPLATVDRQQRMHVMFLATPTMWVHCQIDLNGKLINRQIHQRAAQGDPQLLTFADGSVRIGNSIPYDQKAAAEAKAKIRKASDRPAITY